MALQMRGAPDEAEALARVFEHHPNEGSLRRAPVGMMPKWGGSIRQMRAFFASGSRPEVPDRPGFYAELCAAEAVLCDRTIEGETYLWAVEVGQRRFETLAPLAQLRIAVEGGDVAHTAALMTRAGDGNWAIKYSQTRRFVPSNRPEDREILVEMMMDQRADLLSLIERDPHNTQRIMRRMDVLGEIRSLHAQTASEERAKRWAAAGVGRFFADGPTDCRRRSTRLRAGSC